MPTPHENTYVPQTPPPDVSSSRASFASCPPEEEREAHPPREPREADAQSASASVSLDEQELEHTIGPFAALGPDAQEEASQGLDRGGEKAEHVEDAGVIVAGEAPPSPASSPRETGSDSDTKLGQALALTEMGAKARRKEQADEATPLYLHYPPLERHRVCGDALCVTATQGDADSFFQQLQPHSTTSFLRSGSKFRGTQTSDRQVYEVQVEIKDVDLAESFLCGYLRIQGATSLASLKTLPSANIMQASLTTIQLSPPSFPARSSVPNTSSVPPTRHGTAAKRSTYNTGRASPPGDL